MYLQSFEAIGQVVSEKKIFKRNQSIINKSSITSKIMNQFFPDEQIWERMVPGVCVPSLKAIGPAVPEKKMFEWILIKTNQKSIKINNFKSYQSIFFSWTNLRKSITRSVSVKFQSNWTGGSREEDVLMKYW